MKALIATAMAGAGLAMIGTGPAAAAPNDGTWDIEAYDDCMRKTVRDADLCCIQSGGLPGADKETGCHAPPAAAVSEAEVRAPQWLPPGLTDQLQPATTATEVLLPDVLFPAG